MSGFLSCFSTTLILTTEAPFRATKSEKSGNPVTRTGAMAGEDAPGAEPPGDADPGTAPAIAKSALRAGSATADERWWTTTTTRTAAAAASDQVLILPM